MKVLDDEPQLINAACQGCSQAFEALVLHYEPRIRRMIYSLVQDHYLAQDLCQETFLAAYRALPRMQGTELHLAPWLYRIALNQVRSEWRRRKHVTWVPLSLPQNYGDETFDEPGENYLESSEQFEEQVGQRDLIQKALARLPESAVACLLLDAEGFSYREIAQIMQDSLPAVRSRLSRARRSFQQVYNELTQDRVVAEKSKAKAERLTLIPMLQRQLQFLT